MTEKSRSYPDSSIHSVIAAVSKELPKNPQDLEKILNTLEDYECWEPFFRIIKQKIQSESSREINDYVRMARIYYHCLQDPESAGQVCFQLVRDFRLTFSYFKEDVMVQFMKDEDYAAEAIILEALLPGFEHRIDVINCLERLCLIYEKKKYQEVKLNETYEKLVSLEPGNLKALRYFKIIYTQSQEWDRVARVLRDLYENSKHINDRYRIAQELATVYLYQLSAPKAAIDVIENLCQGSPLDTTAIHFEAFYRMDHWSGCVRVLENYLKKLDNDYEKAIVFYKLGELEVKLDRTKQAIERFKFSLRLDPNLLDPLESLIEVYVEQREWNGLLKSLEHLKKVVQKDHLRERIDEAIGRLQDGLGTMHTS